MPETTPTSGLIPHVDEVIGILVKSNVAATAIFATAIVVRNMWKALRPSDPVVTDAQLIDRLEAKLRGTDANADAEIARLRISLDRPAPDLPD